MANRTNRASATGKTQKTGVPRQPFVGLAMMAALGIIAADFFPVPQTGWLPVGAAFLAAGLAVLRWPAAGSTYALVSLGFFLLHSTQIEDTPGLRLAAQLGDRPRAINATGSVVDEPKIGTNGFATFMFKLESIEIEGRTLPTTATLLVRWRGEPQFGNEFRFFGIAEPISPPRNPGEFDMRSYLRRRDVRRTLFVRYAEDGVLLHHDGGNPILRAAQASRAWMQKILCRSLEDSPDVQNFVSGIALGLRHQTPEDIEEPFQQTGTLHLFAVAGLHVGIVGQLLWVLAAVGRLSRKWATRLIIPLLLFYAAVTGLHVSSVRAAVMSSILLGGFFFERKVFVFNGLAAAAFFLLAWDTNELFSTGFQLSFAVVGSIILLADPLFQFLRRFTSADPFLPRRFIEPAAPAVWYHFRIHLSWRVGFAGCLARVAAAHPLVFSSHYANFVDRQSGGCADRIFHSCHCDVVSIDCATARLAFHCFQQCQLVSGATGSRSRALVRPTSGRSLLCRSTAMA
jgi:competence protein ComEC